MAEPKNRPAPLNDTIITAVAQLVDDAQTTRRDPSHSDLDFEIQRLGLYHADPSAQGQILGKAKRVRATLVWSLKRDPDAGSQLVYSVVKLVRAHGGFRESSPNYVGAHIIENLREAFRAEGYDLASDGQLRPRVLDNLSGVPLSEALKQYVERAKRGADDAALVTGTGKDLLEAVAGHILLERFGTYAATSNFPTLLGQTFIALGLATPEDRSTADEPVSRRVERAMYGMACVINQLRNREGTGHGRPWLPTVTKPEAKMAIEMMGVIGEFLLYLHENRK